MTKQWAIIGPGILMILFVGCIERYYPEEDDLRTGTLVINAHLTDWAGEQVIEISRSAGLTYPSFDPVSGSLAEVIREDGELRIFSESEPGYYRADLDAAFLQTGSAFMLHVITPDGQEYESELERLRPVPAIDSLYKAIVLPTGAILSGGSGFTWILPMMIRPMNTSAGTCAKPMNIITV